MIQEPNIQPPAWLPAFFMVLQQASPTERAEFVLRIINHTQHSLILPKIDGKIAILEDIDLSRKALQARIKSDRPFWWDSEFEGVFLQGAQLDGADLVRANLQGANLIEANLRGGLFFKAQLQDAWLEGARLEHAKMYSVQLESAHLKRASLEDATIINANLQHADLTQANLQRVQGYMITQQDNSSDTTLHSSVVDLRGAQLEGANLQAAQLTGAKLQGANLTHAYLQGTHLEGAYLEQAMLNGRILPPATLINSIGTTLRTDEFIEGFAAQEDQKVHLLGAHMQGVNLWNARFQDAILSESDLSGADMRYIKLHRANLSYVNLKRAKLVNAQLQCAQLREAQLQGADLSRANLQNVNLVGADLQDATLVHTNLEGANLINAKLQGVDLSTCILAHVYLSNAWLDRTRLRQDQLGDSTADEDAARKPNLDPQTRAKCYHAAERAYLVLKQNFDGLGEYGAASWAYCRERRMRKQRIRYEGDHARMTGQRRMAAAKYVSFIGDQLIEWVCDYGESVRRVLITMLSVFVIFTVLYYFISGVAVDAPSQRITREPWDLIRFSLGAMSTLGAPGLQPACLGAQLAMPLQALLTIALTGLLGFVIGNRIRRS